MSFNHHADSSMLELFQVELENQCAILNQGLIEWEQHPQDKSLIESLMRSAHSIKGAATVVGLNPIVKLAHTLEDCFVAVQNHQVQLDVNLIDQLLQAVDFLSHLYKLDIKLVPLWMQHQIPLIEKLILSISAFNSLSSKSSPLKKGKNKEEIQKQEVPDLTLLYKEALETKRFERRPDRSKTFHGTFKQDRVLRVTAKNLNRLMGLAGESLVESHWLYPFEETLNQFKQEQNVLAEQLNHLNELVKKEKVTDRVQQQLAEVQYKMGKCQYQFADRLSELDSFIQRHSNLSDRLYQEVINSRMRPFADGVEAFPRMVRNLARQLGKQVKLQIEGRLTSVDRDILEKLESPLNHLLRNAVDHGIESPEQRLKAGKPVEGLIKLEAHHHAGMLLITVSDDGKGMDIEQLRQEIVKKNLISAEAARELTDSEVLNFVFLPGFSTSMELTDISGRGMGLNIVQNMIRELGGTLRIFFANGKGVTLDLQLPLTLSVIRTLLVEISEEIYAFPLARIDRVFLVKSDQVKTIHHRQYFYEEGKSIGLIPAWQILELDKVELNTKDLSIVVIKDLSNCYGLVVDRLIGEKELVVHELDFRIGKIPDISTGALMEDGAPVLIIDVEDIIQSINAFLSNGQMAQLAYRKDERSLTSERKHILVIDDSLTVREVEGRLLQNAGYKVDFAVNGIDGWNAIRIKSYDLVITDLDMPRMNGIELIHLIKNDQRLKSIPVMIVSYKQDENDRMLGLEAGADYYLTKNSFDDRAMLDAVYDLIGKPDLGIV